MLPMLSDIDVLALTKTGENELHEAGTTLSPIQLEALVLIDGNSSVAVLLGRMPDAPREELRTSLQELTEKGFVSTLVSSDSDALDPGDFFTSASSHADTAVPDDEAHAQATANAEFLRQNGYFVNVVRRSQAKREEVKGRKPTVLVIDDDPGICGLLQTYFKLEGIATRAAHNRDEIVAELHRSPLPDVVLLDIGLPDANGFDILHRMRRHPVLKGLPVIMLTGSATREAVLKAIMGGADGYITKPFDIHHMVRAVKVVLGAQDGPAGQDWDYSL
jgi:two-component system, OmpR family, response regulator